MLEVHFCLSNWQVLSELDIYSIVGANKPLRLEGVRATIRANGVILIRFQGLSGSPIVSGICIKEAAKLPGMLNFLSYNSVHKNK